MSRAGTKWVDSKIYGKYKEVPEWTIQMVQIDIHRLVSWFWPSAFSRRVLPFVCLSLKQPTFNTARIICQFTEFYIPELFQQHDSQIYLMTGNSPEPFAHSNRLNRNQSDYCHRVPCTGQTRWRELQESIEKRTCPSTSGSEESSWQAWSILTFCLASAFSHLIPGYWLLSTSYQIAYFSESTE